MSPLTWKLFMTQGITELAPMEKNTAIAHRDFLALRDRASAAIDSYARVCSREQSAMISEICSLTKTKLELEEIAAEHHKTLEVSRLAAIAAVDAEHAAWAKVKDAEKLLNESQEPCKTQ